MKAKKKELFCGHESVDKYIYDISDELNVVLCPVCNCQLAGEMFKQLAIEHFLPIIPERKGERE